MIASPSPVPSTVVLFSTPSLSNLLNNLSIFSFLIPIPESSTDTINLITSPLITLLTLKSIYPSLVYLTELVSKFNITCLSLVPSPYKYSGIEESYECLNSNGYSPNLALVNNINSSYIFLKL